MINCWTVSVNSCFSESLRQQDDYRQITVLVICPVTDKLILNSAIMKKGKSYCKQKLNSLHSKVLANQSPDKSSTRRNLLTSDFTGQ